MGRRPWLSKQEKKVWHSWATDHVRPSKNNFLWHCWASDRECPSNIFLVFCWYSWADDHGYPNRKKKVWHSWATDHVRPSKNIFPWHCWASDRECPSKVLKGFLLILMGRRPWLSKQKKKVWHSWATDHVRPNNNNFPWHCWASDRECPNLKKCRDTHGPPYCRQLPNFRVRQRSFPKVLLS